MNDTTETGPDADTGAPASTEHPWLIPDGPTLARTLPGILAGTREGLIDGRIAPSQSVRRTTKEVAAIDLDEPIGAEAAALELADLMERGDLRSAGSRCFGYFNPTAAWPGVLADVVVSARNPQLAVTTHAPASMAMERRALAWMIERIGWSGEASGHFTSGGSEANGAGLLVALIRADADFADQGVRALRGAPRIYASADSHLAWVKLARAAGIGAAAVRLIPTDGAGRMSSEALAQTVESDQRAGDVPILVAATVGTTNAGAIDPVAECRAICDRFGVHLHVDSAWAGALAASDEHRHHVAELELADSLTIDAHKWLSVPMGTGMVFVRNREWLHRAYGVATGYMPTGDGEDAYITTGQWSRRFLGARLWMMLRANGRAGYEALFRAHFALARSLRDELPTHGWRVLNDTPLPVVLFEDAREGAESQAIADGLEHHGELWLGRVEYEGRSALRACMTSFLTGPDDTAVLLERLGQVRRAVTAAGA
ncbi:MAG: aminotransferase class V-fold PLP-dependent enzyme [Planctomycetota bacterium]